MPLVIPDRHLDDLETQVSTALHRGDGAGLDVLGYGEVTLVLRLSTDRGTYACKRLPVFPDEARYQKYRQSLEDYLAGLDRADLRVAETVLWCRPHPSGGIVAYCVQPELPAERLCNRLLHSQDETWARDFFARLLDAVDRVVTPVFGLDSQAANWVDLDGDLVYLDVTTPLMRAGDGSELLDVRLFFTSLPWVLRDAVRLTTSKAIFDKFYSPRGVVLDFLGNLHKEGLGRLVPALVALANERLDEPLTVGQVEAYYRSDARTWQLVQQLRRIDRSWQRQVRRRPYPFLLPPAIAR